MRNVGIRYILQGGPDEPMTSTMAYTPFSTGTGKRWMPPCEGQGGPLP